MYQQKSGQRRPYSVALISILAATFLLAGMNTGAQVLEEIVVTAQKRQQNLMDVGIAITALTGRTGARTRHAGYNLGTRHGARRAARAAQLPPVLRFCRARRPPGRFRRSPGAPDRGLCGRGVRQPGLRFGFPAVRPGTGRSPARAAGHVVGQERYRRRHIVHHQQADTGIRGIRRSQVWQLR